MIFRMWKVRATRKAAINILPWSLAGLGAAYISQRRSNLNGKSALEGYFLMLWNGALPRPIPHICSNPECIDRQLDYPSTTEAGCTVHNREYFVESISTLLRRCNHKLHNLLSNVGNLSSRQWPTLNDRVQIFMSNNTVNLL